MADESGDNVGQRKLVAGVDEKSQEAIDKLKVNREKNLILNKPSYEEVAPGPGSELIYFESTTAGGGHVEKGRVRVTHNSQI